MLERDDYGRRTLDFVQAVVSAGGDRKAIWRLSREEFAHYGLDFLTIWYIPTSGQSLSEAVTYNSRPQDYVKNYNDRGFVDRDPVVTHMQRSRTVLSWSEVRQRNLGRAERSIIDEAYDFGASDGLTIPIVTTSGLLGVVSPCGNAPNLTPRARSAIELVALYTHQALERAAPPMRKESRLTTRETEIMKWVAVGKTNDEIGVILGIQASTVKTLLARAQEKLDAVNRTYAVVQALKGGELSLNSF